MTTALPDLHGWLPAAALARAEGVHPSTVRKRAKRGAVAAIPNPVGPGHLFHGAQHAEGRFRLITQAPGGSGRKEVVSGFSRDGFSPSAADLLVMGVLPSSSLGVARALGFSNGKAHRHLTRLQRAGLVTRGESVPPGPRGGRPEIVWRVVA